MARGTRQQLAGAVSVRQGLSALLTPRNHSPARQADCCATCASEVTPCRSAQHEPFYNDLSVHDIFLDKAITYGVAGQFDIICHI